MKLQLALDTPDLIHELDLVGKVAPYIDVIEAGTPLLIREGIRAVRELRRRYRGRPVVADIKVIDAGEPIAELAFAAGANIVTVLSVASDEVIAKVVRSAKRYDGEVMADSLGVADIPARARQLRELGVSSLCINRRGFEKSDDSREVKATRLADLVGSIELPVYLAGGIDHDELMLLRDLPLAGVIIGAAIAEAPNAIESAKRMRAILDHQVF
ncbi:MAG: orotidine 5'-phosphate decarboxylase [Acidobacteria bacterium]|nr:orotidine 5'-phosphate decarboxylase [Acidobacteriota bacterium]MBI3423322.1 orotidine 5'-phosphate decarboxylase [Acidobacteriota bacterium]